MPDQTTTRPLYEIAADIRRNWADVYFGAVPYLEAMERLDKLTDKIGWDDGETAVRYFLSNTKTWKGPEAHRIKNELRAMVGLPLAKAPKPKVQATASDIDRGAAGQVDDARAQRRADAAIVKAAVVRHIFCPFTGDLLDMRRAVVVDTGTKVFVCTAKHWDLVKADIFAAMAAMEKEIKVLDGRELFTPAGRVR